MLGKACLSMICLLVTCLCSMPMSHAQNNWEFLKLHSFNSRVAKVINELDYAKFQSIYNQLRNPKDQDAWKALFVKMKSHPLKAMPLFDRLFLVSGKSAFTIVVLNIDPLKITVNGGKPITIDRNNIHNSINHKSPAAVLLNLALTKAQAEETDHAAWTPGEVAEAFGFPVGAKGLSFRDPDCKDQPDACHSGKLSEALAEYLNFMHMKSIECSEKPSSLHKNDAYYHYKPKDGDLVVTTAEGYKYMVNGRGRLHDTLIDPASKYTSEEIKEVWKVIQPGKFVYDLPSKKNAINWARTVLEKKKISIPYASKFLTIKCDVAEFSKKTEPVDKCFLQIYQDPDQPTSAEINNINKKLGTVELLVLAKYGDASTPPDEKIYSEIAAIWQMVRMDSNDWPDGRKQAIGHGMLGALSDCCLDVQCRQNVNKSGKVEFTGEAPQNRSVRKNNTHR